VVRTLNDVGKDPLDGDRVLHFGAPRGLWEVHWAYARTTRWFRRDAFVIATGSRKIDELLRQCGPAGRRDAARAEGRGAGLTVTLTLGRPLEQ
jgi:hypothetical protein